MIKIQLGIFLGVISILLSSISIADTDKPLDAVTRAEVVDSLSKELVAHYVFLDKAQAMATAIQEKQQGGEYDAIIEGSQFAARLADDLFDITHDKHLRITYSALVLPSRDEEERMIAAQEAKDAARTKVGHPIKAATCTLDEIRYTVFDTECLPGNIGYLAVQGFIGKNDAADSIAAAMNRLKNTRALIIDLRDNGGGDGNTANLLASYFFDRPTHLSDIYERQHDHTEEIWTSNNIAGKKYGEKRTVYVLTSVTTFSAAEDFSYAMKTFKRATLIGETTSGGANATVSGPYRVLDHFTAYIPDARSIGTISKTNWEGVGVIPDISVSAYDALAAAQVLELNKIMKSEKDAKRRAQLQTRVSELKQEMISHESIEASR
jgi:hypothetical protein